MACISQVLQFEPLNFTGGLISDESGSSRSLLHWISCTRSSQAAKVKSMPSSAWPVAFRCSSQRKNPLDLRVRAMPGWNNALPGSFLKPSQMSCTSCSVRMRKSPKSYNPSLCQAVYSFLAVKPHSRRQYSVAYSLFHGGLGCIAKFAWRLTMMLVSQVALFAPVLSSCLAILPVAIKQVR